MSKKTRIVECWPSWRLKSSSVEAYVTETGGHLAPVVFDRKRHRFQPYSVAPWCCEKLPDQPRIIQVLRGDFFCLPFGGNAKPHQGEQHPVHGETANRTWKCVANTTKAGEHVLHLRLKTKIRPGTVDKFVGLRDGENVVYCRDVLTGFRGRMNLGHHATLRFPDREGSGLISTSPFVHGQVFVEPTELPAQKGYSLLAPGARFTDLRQVRTITHELADLSRYPARRGFEDIAILVADPKLDVAWTAVSFPQEHCVWFALKDPKVLASTLIWHSNGGRYMPPWSGRHVNVIGLEEITSYFHYGLHESVTPNTLSRKGYRTCVELSPKRPTVINYIMACVPAPAGFDRVKRLDVAANGKAVVLRSENGKRLRVAVDVDFLKG